MNNVLTIQQLFADRLFRIPDYQRGFAWEAQQLVEFLGDLTLLAEGKDHFTGTIVLHPYPKDNKGPCIDEEGKQYEEVAVVDGQQRLTTIVLLLDAIHREMVQIPSLTVLGRGTRKGYVAATGRDGQPLYRLELNRDCRTYFIDDVLSDTPGPAGAQIQSHRRLSFAKQFFGDFLKALRGPGESYPDWLEKLRNKIVHQLKVTLSVVPNEPECYSAASASHMARSMLTSSVTPSQRSASCNSISSMALNRRRASFC
jgi:hypothetical protein